MYLAWIYSTTGRRLCVITLRHFPAPYGSGKWHLYNVKKDPGETLNLADEHPELLKKLQDRWERYADDVGVILTE